MSTAYDYVSTILWAKSREGVQTATKMLLLGLAMENAEEVQQIEE